MAMNKKNSLRIIAIAAVIFSFISCSNQEREINKEGVESDKISVKSAVLDEYGKLMPQCKNIVTVDVEGIDIQEALVYIDNDAGDAYILTEGVGLVPYEVKNNVSMIVSFEEEGGTKEFKVADKLPEPQIRFFNAETFEIQDYDIENETTVIIEVVADDKFAELFPEDSEYIITEYKAVQMRGEEKINSIESEIEYSSNQIDISSLQENAQAEDDIVINITGLQRIDFEGNTHEIEVPEKMQEINLTVK